MWELKKGSGGEGEFIPALSDGPARTGGGRPRPPRRVTGGSSRRGGILPSSSRPADGSPPHGAGGLRALRQPRSPPAMAVTGPRGMSPSEGPGPAWGSPGRQRPPAPSPSPALRGERRCWSHVASSGKPRKAGTLLAPPVAEGRAVSGRGRFSLWSLTKAAEGLFAQTWITKRWLSVIHVLVAPGWDHAPDVGRLECPSRTMGIPKMMAAFKLSSGAGKKHDCNSSDGFAADFKSNKNFLFNGASEQIL